MAPLTPEQREAVERRDGPLLVRAGAGSGKTRVLVERFVAAVREDGVPADRILAVTFTEKAAAEMRSRVRARLVEEGDREAARAAESAAIATIHGFCARLLRASALAAGLDPDFRVLDETEAARVALDAFDGALEEFLASAAAGDRLDLAAAYGPDRLRTMVVAVHGRLRSRGESEPSLPPVAAPRAGEERERLARAVAAAAAELAAGGRSGAAVERAAGTLERCDRLLGRLPAGELAEPDDLAALEVKAGNAAALKTPAFEELREAHAAYLTLCEAARAAAHHAMLARLLELFGARYAALKEERSALDFEDLELRARDLLAADPALREAVRGRFEHVMVDELQDTNPLQNEIVDMVAAGNLFAVGDERQSIYGFRHADVGLFRERAGAAAAAGRAGALRTSFRARPELLAALNAAFASVWPDFEPLLPAGGAEPEPAGPGPCVELLVVDRSKQRWEDALGAGAFGEGVGETIWRAAEARLLARRVDDLAGPGRPFAHGDVAILLRAATDMALYERALVERGIPAYSHGGRGFAEAQQVGDLRAYLAALANPLDEMALTMLLASPLAGASLDALALVRLRARALRRDLWWTLEQGLGAGGDGSDGLAGALRPDDRERLAAFVDRLARERAEAPRLSLETLIDRAVTESGYDRVVLAMPGGDRRLANVRKLMRLARRFEADSGRDLRGFIDHLDERELLRAHEGEAPVEGESRAPAVRLMTVHAAKGLEFPLVCVADLGRPAGGREAEGLQVAQDGRVGLKLASLSGERRGALEWERLKEEQDALAEEEERRILYVAMTRARDRLVLSGATDVERWPDPRPLGRPIDWVWRAVAPGARNVLENAYTGVDVRDGEPGAVRVACTLCAPETVDEALPPADRRPGTDVVAAAAPGAGDGGAAAATARSGAAPLGAAPALPRPDLRPIPAGLPLPVARLSYSALEGYRRCGYRFYLERVVRMRPGDPRHAAAPVVANGHGQLALALDEASAPPRAADEEAVTPLLRGTIVHELLERLDMRAPSTPDAAAIAERLTARRLPVEPDEVERIAALIDGFLGSALRERIARGSRVRTELPFAFELSPGAGRPVLVNGVVDVHVEEPNGVLVVDYKTDPLGLGAGGSASRDRLAEPAALVERSYSTQRLVYALAALRSGAPRVEVAYSFLEAPGEPVAAAYEAADAADLERRLVELAGDLLAGRFEPTAAPHRELCWTCPGRPALCSWGPEHTLRERPPVTPDPEGTLAR